MISFVMTERNQYCRRAGEMSRLRMHYVYYKSERNIAILLQILGVFEKLMNKSVA